jgi:putative ABC transport system ATP-binding protein
MSLLHTTNLGKVFEPGATPTVALANVDIEINKGDFISVVGPSGSGKSTLLQILGLLDSPTSGTYVLDGRDTNTLSEDELANLRNEKMGFVFQSFNLLPRTSVLENVKLPLAYSRIQGRLWNEMAERQIAAVGLTHRIHHEPAQLSGGERQRVAIARALVADPDIIFADEPTGNLDSASGRAVIETLDTLHKNGKTLVLITHDRTIAKKAQHAIVMQDGRVAWRGNARDIPEL